MSFMPPNRRLDAQFDRAKKTVHEADRHASDYSRMHPDGPVPNPRPHPIVHRLWRVLQGRHHGHDD
jgi:hypothetical protein